MRVAIHQPQFLPWLGYLDKIDQADLFVALDNVQYKKTEWQNRNRIRTPQGWQWLTVPVLQTFRQRIMDTTINQTVDWRGKHLRTIERHYRRAAYRDRFLEGLREVYRRPWERLSDLNLAVLKWLLEAFGIKTPLRFASEMTLREEPTDRLIDICRGVGATHYLSGVSGPAYMDMPRFEASGVRLEVQDFHHPVYPQCYNPFIPGMAAIDLLFTSGDDALRQLREARRAPVRSMGAG